MTFAVARWQKRSIFCAVACLTSVLSPLVVRSEVQHGEIHGDVAMHGHLYVASGPFATPGIYRFPLTDGLPATTPDAVLTGGNPSWPYSIAFDGAGYLYVSDISKDLINVYSPGAEGNEAPVRTISVPLQAESIAVNRAGYLFTTYGNYGVEDFAPGAGAGSQPLTQWSPNGGVISTLVMDASGRLYAQGEFGPIYRYSDPVDNQTPDAVITAQGYQEGPGMTFPMAIEQDQEKIFFQVYPHLRGPIHLGAHAGRDLSLSPTVPDVVSMSSDCHGNATGTEYGLAVNRKYLMYSCSENYAAVLVYHNAPGRQKLVEIISPPGMAGAYGETFGP